ncbi:17615_t:CDS:2, partial [Gigaspora rosea]
YKANSIKQAIDAISQFFLHNSPIRVNLHNRYLFSDLYAVLQGKMRDMQEQGFGEVKGSIALNSQQLQEILQHPRIDRSNPTNLLYRIFMHLSILLAMHGGEHYQLKHGLQKGQAQVISIPLDTTGPCDNIKFYLSKQPSVADLEFYLQPNSNWIELGIWYKKDHVGKNKLMNFMREIGRIMQLTEHKSVQEIRAYKQINEEQQLQTINTLISITDSNSNDNDNYLTSQTPLQEITNMNF